MTTIPDYAVGRIDFARLTVFNPLTEVDLLKRYFAKDFKYRANGVPTFGRVSFLSGNSQGPNGMTSALGLSGAAFGVAPGTIISGFNLRDKVPADFGVHFYTGTDIAVQDGLGVLHASSAFADPAQEIPVTFRQVWFSYAEDWARLNAQNQVFVNNNWLRSSLGWPNYGLATVGGYTWDFTLMGGGAPLAELMRLGWLDVAPTFEIPRFQSILGDPTLRLHRVSPVKNINPSRAGSVVTLTWTPSADSGCRYYVYRSTSGLDGFSSPLNSSSPVDGCSYIDSGAPANATYQVRATKLQITGSGSFWNLSQGTFITVP
ncbi:MAG TPA: hypothetical protein PLX89_09195 [Verrucomicrobiota bacterium]|nr:hypothetical protein [Verrucomicrobiota bacterium]